MDKKIFDGFHPLIRNWFLDRFSVPTDIQERAWPCIARKKHVLITAPTGSGKTLTAFLWSLNQLITGRFLPGETRVLYISPLKALNNDIRVNLKKPLKDLKSIFDAAGEPFPDIRVLTRSGDTSQQDRRKMFRHPPEILITTPESLNLLLSSKSGIQVLGGLTTVILDEIHAVAGTKRGVYLMTAVERLVRLSGEFQRICLSATVENHEQVAAYVGGFKVQGHPPSPRYTARPMEEIQSNAHKESSVRVRFPDREEAPVDQSVWDILAEEFKDLLDRNRATLFFTNGRRLCEKMTYKINRLAGRPLAYSHHGSLSRELRHDVEQHLKNGELKAIVATSSLEMGIDIGSLDEVVLIQSPPSVSSAVQRIGRAGHRVNTRSRGSLYAAHRSDLIASAVLAKAVQEKNIEPIKSVDCPLDILAQVLISMTGLETWDMDELFCQVRASFPFHSLSRRHFDLVLEMLAGRYADERIRELNPRLSIDRLDNTVRAKKGALLALYTSGGTIPDRGYFQLRHHETNARIGELDEEYVWEAKIGQVATVGTQNWKIMRITHNDVFAVPVGNRLMDAPFWIAEGISRDFHFSNLILHFLEEADQEMNQSGFRDILETAYHMEASAAGELIRFLKTQKERTGTALPHRHHLLLEYVRSGPDGGPGTMLVLHTLWGAHLNRPYALALEAAWQKRFQEVPEIFPGNDAIVIQLPNRIEPTDILSLVTSSNLEDLLKEQLERSGFFAARFRECAGRALLITKNKISQRMPLWMTRLKSKKLLENVLGYKDFPILLETWRTCLKDEFDLEVLKRMLDELGSGDIAWSVARTSRPSPFAAGMAWNQINQYMYQTDQGASSSSLLGENLIQDLVFSSDLRPQVPGEVVTAFELKCQRLAPGYAPKTARDLAGWIKERVAVPFGEWEALLQRMDTDGFESPEVPRGKGKTIGIPRLLSAMSGKLACLHIRSGEAALVVSLELVSKIACAWYGIEDLSGPGIRLAALDGSEFRTDQKEFLRLQEGDDEAGMSLLGQWLRFYGPQSAAFIRETLGMEEKMLLSLIESLTESGGVISGLLVKEGPDEDICDADNFEILLRLSRSERVPRFEALDIKKLPLFLAFYQGFPEPGHDLDGLSDILEQLACLPISASLWETEVLPARVRSYHPSFLDTVLQEGGFRWLGFEKRQVRFFFRSDLDLMGDSVGSDLEFREAESRSSADPELEALFAPEGARFDFMGLLGRLGCDAKSLSKRLWKLVWLGRLSNETFLPVRKGLETRFRTPDLHGADPGSPVGKGSIRRISGRRFSGRSGFLRWKGQLPMSGYFFRPEKGEGPMDLLEAEELNRDRVRLLLDRYGILFREVVSRELPGFRWADIFRSLRLMELSGEIYSGHFFKEIPGLQFASRRAVQILKSGVLPETDIFLMNAADPASACGIGLGALKQGLPRRSATTHMVFQGSDLKLVSTGNGKSLDIRAEPEDPDLKAFVSPLARLLTRQFMPLKSIRIEEINGDAAVKSPYLSVLSEVFDLEQGLKHVTLYRKID